VVAAAVTRIEALVGPVPAVEFQIVDLPDNLLGVAAGHTIQIDLNAAGYGWVLGQESRDEGQEPDRDVWNMYASSIPGPSTLDSRLRVDLLTVVLHELGHVLGYNHADEGIMQERLSLGERRLWDDVPDPWDDPHDLEDILARETLGAKLVAG
jgi:hypothetical protein